MVCVAEALSPSLSVIVAVSVTRLSADSVFDSFGLLVRRVNHRPDLVQRHIAGRIDRHREHEQRSIRAVRPRQPTAVENQVHRLPARRVDKTRRTRNDAQRIADRAGAVGAERRGERTREARRRIRRQIGLVDRQRQARGRRADRRAVVQEHRFWPMVCVAEALSPSLSVIVAVSVTRLSADSVVDSFGLLFVG